jgi:hypothetical protein
LGSEEDLRKRNEVFSNNIRPKIKPKGFFEIMWDQLKDFTMRILMLCALLDIVL